MTSSKDLIDRVGINDNSLSIKYTSIYTYNNDYIWVYMNLTDSRLKLSNVPTNQTTPFIKLLDYLGQEGCHIMVVHQYNNTVIISYTVSNNKYRYEPIKITLCESEKQSLWKYHDYIGHDINSTYYFRRIIK